MKEKLQYMGFHKKTDFVLAAVLYMIINLLFVDKYTARITEWHYLCDIVYLLISTCLIFLSTWSSKREWSFRSILCIGGLVCISTLIWLQYQIDPMQLHVDRWSAIHNFLYNLFHGVYPYAAQTHSGGYGSPFPVWQILHIPFYLLGNVGLSFFAVLILFLCTMVKCVSPRAATISLLLIVFSPAITYEVAVRSDLFTNFLLVCSLCLWLQFKHVEIESSTYLIATIVGLCASTRLATVIPLAYLYGYAFLQLNWQKQIGFIVTTCAVFILTFLPFMLWDAGQLFFFEYNPFVLQTRQGSPLILISFALIAICWTIYKKNDTQHFELYAGCLLTLLVVITFLHNMISSGNFALFSSQYDITYFNMALPFYICSLTKSLTP